MAVGSDATQSCRQDRSEVFACTTLHHGAQHVVLSLHLASWCAACGAISSPCIMVRSMWCYLLEVDKPLPAPWSLASPAWSVAVGALWPPCWLCHDPAPVCTPSSTFPQMHTALGRSFSLPCLCWCLCSRWWQWCRYLAPLPAGTEASLPRQWPHPYRSAHPLSQPQ